MSTELRAVSLAECCRRLNISLRTGEQLLSEGRFPIPELPRLGKEGSKLPRRTYSTAEIDRYLDTASTEPRVWFKRVAGGRR